LDRQALLSGTMMDSSMVDHMLVGKDRMAMCPLMKQMGGMKH
jgi:hypothetical protein